MIPNSGTHKANISPMQALQDRKSFLKAMRTAKRVATGKRVGTACILCKRARVRCDDFRPCRRCARLGDNCADMGNMKDIPESFDKSGMFASNVQTKACQEGYKNTDGKDMKQPELFDDYAAVGMTTGLHAIGNASINHPFAMLPRYENFIKPGWLQVSGAGLLPLPSSSLLLLNDLQHNYLPAFFPQILPDPMCGFSPRPSFEAYGIHPRLAQAWDAAYAPERPPADAALPDPPESASALAILAAAAGSSRRS